MATTTRARLQGFKELDKVLKALPGRLAERELTSAVRAGARVIVKEARARAPRGAVPSEMSKKFGPLHKKIRARRVRKTRHSVEFAIDTGSAWYGALLEFGTKDIAPRPWMTPAFDTSAQPALAKIGTALAKGIEKTATELAGKFGSIRKSTLKRL